jgi:hypothetical protein
MSSVDTAMLAAKALTHALLNPAPAAPFAQIDNNQHSVLKQLAAIFQTANMPHAAALPTAPKKLHRRPSL